MAKEKQTLNEAERVVAVLNAAGRATCIAEYLPPKYQKQLAELCAANGTVVPGVRDKVITILREHGKEHKAEIDGAEPDVLETVADPLKKNPGFEAR